MEKNITNQVIKLDYNYKKLRSDLNFLKKENNSNISNFTNDINQKIESNKKETSNELKLIVNQNDQRLNNFENKIENNLESIKKNMESIELKLDQKMDKINFNLDFEKIFGASLLLQLIMIK